MSTKPTRMQSQALDLLADAILLVADGARLDGKGTLLAADLAAIAGRVAAASSAFGPDAILARSLERRVRKLGLPSGACDLLILMEDELKPPDLLLQGDEELRALIARLEEDLGEV